MTVTAQEVERYRAFLTTQLDLPGLTPHLIRLHAVGSPVSVERLAAAAGPSGRGYQGRSRTPAAPMGR